MNIEVREPLAEECESIATQIYQPSFPETQCPPGGFLPFLTSDQNGKTLALFNEGKAVAAISALRYPEAPDIMLVAWLAVHPHHRGSGYGSQLLTAAIRCWEASEPHPRLILAEIEDPRFHATDVYGDPSKRVKFYQRLGAKRLDLDYVMPVVSGSRFPAMILIAVGGTQIESAQPAGQPLQDFLTAYAKDSVEPRGESGFADPAIEEMLEQAPHARLVLSPRN